MVIPKLFLLLKTNLIEHLWPMIKHEWLLLTAYQSAQTLIRQVVIHGKKIYNLPKP